MARIWTPVLPPNKKVFPTPWSPWLKIISYGSSIVGVPRTWISYSRVTRSTCSTLWEHAFPNVYSTFSSSSPSFARSVHFSEIRSKSKKHLAFSKIFILPIKFFNLSTFVRVLQGAKKVKAQGMGAHTQEEVAQFGCDDLKVLCDMLSDKPFFFGDEPTTVSHPRITNNNFFSFFFFRSSSKKKVGITGFQCCIENWSKYHFRYTFKLLPINNTL